MAVAESYGLT